MQRVAEAVSHGAVSIVNAMATGKGAAMGIALWTKARVTLTNHPDSVTARNLSDPSESTALMETTVRRVLRRFRAHRKFGALVETCSNIPIAVGLKSSSAASNAIAMATLKALGDEASDNEAVNLGVDASLEARVTLTGAFDDACACFFGGIVATDNTRRIVLRRHKPKTGMHVLIHVPKEKKYTRDVSLSQVYNIAPFIRVAHQEAMKDNYWLAMTLNGLIYSKAFGYGSLATRLALKAGAIASGLSGKGPAVAAVVTNSRVDQVLSKWASLPGRIIETSFNNTKVRVRRMRN
jgi:shikimate kinase